MEEREERGLWLGPLLRNTGHQSLLLPRCITQRKKKDSATPTTEKMTTHLTSFQASSLYTVNIFGVSKWLCFGRKERRKIHDTRKASIQARRLPPLLQVWWINAVEAPSEGGVVRGAGLSVTPRHEVKTAEFFPPCRNDSILDPDQDSSHWKIMLSTPRLCTLPMDSNTEFTNL